MYAKLAGAGVAIKQACHAFINAILGGARWIGQICVRFSTACSNVTNAGSRRVVAMSTSTKNRFVRTVHYVAAWIYRFGFRTLVGAAVFAIIVGLPVYYWPAAPKPVHYHREIRHWSPDVVHRLLPKAQSDTGNADYYYVVNILFVPVQTFLLFFGGLYAWRTLSQSHKFKQHDIETRCIAEYLALEQRLADAGHDNAKIESAVRAYWILMLYEYYWWRHDLLSRELFANWCEFRAQRFQINQPYGFTQPRPGSKETVPFTTYQDGYTYFKKAKVFPSPSKFDSLMQSLIDRPAAAKSLRWIEIERYRHGKDFS
jgi:hypothetical protein